MTHSSKPPLKLILFGRFQHQVVFFSFVLYFVTSLPLLAEHTRRWRQSTYDEFLKGTAHGVAVRSDGRLELAPKFSLLADADASYLWSVRLDPKGTLYAAGGSPAKVFRFDSSGRAAVVFDSTDLSAQAIAAKFTKSLRPAKSPFSSIRKQNTSGTSLSLPTGLSTSPPGIRVRSSPFRPTARANSSTPATRHTFAFWRSIQTET